MAAQGTDGPLTIEVARHSVARLRDGLSGLAADAGAMVRWLLAMAFVLNGAGCWLALDRPALVPAGQLKSLLTMFGFGIGVAILAGMAALGLAIPLAAAIRAAVTAWTEVSAGGDISDEALESARKVRMLGAIRLGATCLLGLLSYTLFAFGCAVMAAGEPALQATAPKSVPAPAARRIEPLAAVPVTPPNILVAAPKPTPSATPTPEPSPTPSAAERRQARLAKEKAEAEARKARAERIERRRERRRARAAAAAAANAGAPAPAASPAGPQ